MISRVFNSASGNNGVDQSGLQGPLTTALRETQSSGVIAYTLASRSALSGVDYHDWFVPAGSAFAEGFEHLKALVQTLPCTCLIDWLQQATLAPDAASADNDSPCGQWLLKVLAELLRSGTTPILGRNLVILSGPATQPTIAVIFVGDELVRGKCAEHLIRLSLALSAQPRRDADANNLIDLKNILDARSHDLVENLTDYLMVLLHEVTDFLFPQELGLLSSIHLLQRGDSNPGSENPFQVQRIPHIPYHVPKPDLKKLHLIGKCGHLHSHDPLAESSAECVPLDTYSRNEKAGCLAAHSSMRAEAYWLTKDSIASLLNTSLRFVPESNKVIVPPKCLPYFVASLPLADRQRKLCVGALNIEGYVEAQDLEYAQIRFAEAQFLCEWAARTITRAKPSATRAFIVQQRKNVIKPDTMERPERVRDAWAMVFGLDKNIRPDFDTGRGHDLLAEVARYYDADVAFYDFDRRRWREARTGHEKQRLQESNDLRNKIDDSEVLEQALKNVIWDIGAKDEWKLWESQIEPRRRRILIPIRTPYAFSDENRYCTGVLGLTRDVAWDDFDAEPLEELKELISYLSSCEAVAASSLDSAGNHEVYWRRRSERLITNVGLSHERLQEFARQKVENATTACNPGVCSFAELPELIAWSESPFWCHAMAGWVTYLATPEPVQNIWADLGGRELLAPILTELCERGRQGQPRFPKDLPDSTKESQSRFWIPLLMFIENMRKENGSIAPRLDLKNGIAIRQEVRDKEAAQHQLNWYPLGRPGRGRYFAHRALRRCYQDVITTERLDGSDWLLEIRGKGVSAC